MNTKFIALAGLVAVFASACATQPFDNTKPIETEYGFWGKSYSQEGEKLNLQEMHDELSVHEASKEHMSTYKAFHTPAIILSAVGGGLIGWPLGTQIGGGDPNWTLAYIGAGVAVTGTVLELIGQSHLTRAVDAYNRSIKGGAARGMEWRPVAACHVSGCVGGVQLRY